MNNILYSNHNNHINDRINVSNNMLKQLNQTKSYNDHTTYLKEENVHIFNENISNDPKRNLNIINDKNNMIVKNGNVNVNKKKEESQEYVDNENINTLTVIYTNDELMKYMQKKFCSNKLLLFFYKQ